jgi:hypothetical protein
MKTPLISICVGIFIAIASWAPLWIIEARDPYAMPFALGLLTIAVSFVGGVTAMIGLIRLVIHALKASKAPS